MARMGVTQRPNLAFELLSLAFYGTGKNNILYGHEYIIQPKFEFRQTFQ